MSDSEYINPEALKARFGDRIRIGTGCRISRSTVIEIADDGFLAIGNGVTTRRGVTLEVDRQAVAVIGDNVDIGENAFIYVMCGLYIGSGVGISNMVDIHDHNHRERAARFLPDSTLDTCASGFEAAPVVVEDGAVISNKVTLVAGVRVGANTLVGANSVVSRSLPPNSVAAGAPARPFRSFDGPLSQDRSPHTLRVGFFGTSIMEHYEAYTARMFQQWNLPKVGEQVTVESVRRRGYPARLADTLRVTHPHVRWQFDNHSMGGANSRDILARVTAATRTQGERYDVAYTGCGLNDVWRGFQGRTDDAVGIDEYRKNVGEIVARLKSSSRRVVFLGETPFALPVDELDEMNRELRGYAEAARAVCVAQGAEFVDCYGPFVEHVRMTAGIDEEHSPGLWGDGIHLSDQGDALMVRILLSHADSSQLFTDLFEYERLQRDAALIHYRELTGGWRASREAPAGIPAPGRQAEPVPATSQETALPVDLALPLVKRWRSAGQTIVWTNGCFDLLHDGHVRFLRDARALGDRLVVGLNSDESVRRLKGADRPVVPFDQRADQLLALRSVDCVVALAQDRPVPEIEAIRPDICCKDDSYLRLPLPERPVVEGYGGSMRLLPRYEGLSTTGVVARIQQTGPTI